MNLIQVLINIAITMIITITFGVYADSYVIVDTGQSLYYDNSKQIPKPKIGESYYGQDAQFNRNQPYYQMSSDRLTVYDKNTGLTWQRSPDTNGDGSVSTSDKLTWINAQALPAKLNTTKFGGYSDWRLPTIKELYSLINFNGTDPNPTATSMSDLTPFIDTNYFTFQYGQTSAGERIIDSQYASSTLDVSKGLTGDKLFGVNFADGRIKGYGLTMLLPGQGGGQTPIFSGLNGEGGQIPTGYRSMSGQAGLPSPGPGIISGQIGPQLSGAQLESVDKTFYVICVRGNPDYGKNSFVRNGDGTINDSATGLMWSENDSGSGMNWKDALSWVQLKNKENYLGHNDWRLPNAKELQSIVDYTRSPDSTGSAAIDPVFNSTKITNEAGQADYPFYWTGTTHIRSDGSGEAGVYIAFGRSLGYMFGQWLDVHGAGSQRSDPKSGNASDYPQGRGPQGDAIRINNYVRLVRDLPAPSVPVTSLTTSSTHTLGPQPAVTRKKSPSLRPVVSSIVPASAPEGRLIHLL